MNRQEPLKEIVTVTEMARMCGLSRARFYQLVGDGVFPAPSRNEMTKRPFFDQEQQQQCLLVRRTNRGVNDKAVMFYGYRAEMPPSTPKPRTPKRIARKAIVNQPDQRIVELRHGLTQLGTSANDRDIRRALTDLYPDGCDGVEPNELLRAVFGQLRDNK